GGYYLALNWSGESYAIANAQTSASGYGFAYFVGLIYYVFGRNQLLVQFVNGTIGSLSVAVIYAIGRRLFDARSARWAALFMAFFPGMIFWSCAMYKDPSILLCIAVAMYATLRLRERFTAPMVALLVGACMYLLTLRFYTFYMVAFAILGTFLFAQRRGALGSLFGQLVLIVAFLGAVFFGVKSERLEQQGSYFDLNQLQTARSGQTSLGKSAYGAEINVSTAEGALSVLPIGLVYLLFAPFPWAVSGTRQLLTLPETLIWYGLMPSLIRG